MIFNGEPLSPTVFNDSFLQCSEIGILGLKIPSCFTTASDSKAAPALGKITYKSVREFSEAPICCFVSHET